MRTTIGTSSRWRTRSSTTTDTKSTINQRKYGVDVDNFPEGLRRALRIDRDIILVGEMRDLATIHAALEAAETGHVVFGTLHTSGAASTINRIIDVFPKEQQGQIRTQLSTALIGVLSQASCPGSPKASWLPTR